MGHIDNCESLRIKSEGRRLTCHVSGDNRGSLGAHAPPWTPVTADVSFRDALAFTPSQVQPKSLVLRQLELRFLWRIQQKTRSSAESEGASRLEHLLRRTDDWDHIFCQPQSLYVIFLQKEVLIAAG